jgi:ceramide glucosyltransferase
MTVLTISAGGYCALATILHFVSIGTVIARHCRPERMIGLRQQSEGVSIVRPLCGIENFSAATLGSTFNLDHSNYEILFCAAHNTDPVLPLIRQLMAEHPDVPARLLLGYDCVSANPKLNNLVKGWQAARHEHIVMADSNVLMPVDYIGRLLATWDARAGLVCSPPVGCAPDGAWAELECAFLNTYQARWQSFADALGFAFAQGKTMLWRRHILEHAGGIRALAGELAEDAAATKLVRKQGLRVRLVDRPFHQPLGQRTLAQVWQRQLRWARLRRDTFKPFFAAEIFAGAIPPLAAGTLLAAAMEWPVAAVTAALACLWYAAEVILARAAGWHLSWRSVAFYVIRDLLLPALWIATWIGNEFEWRGNVMRVAERSSTA